ncbi:MAG: hypothetical protein AB7S26_42735 [Sandaracinaceae bacterium]
MGLANADVQELTWFFATPCPAVARDLAAQSYEPRGSGSYDPFADDRLARLVLEARDPRTTQWGRIASILSSLETATRDVLAEAFGPDAESDGVFAFPRVAALCPAALQRGRELAREQEHHRLLERAYQAARHHGAGPVDCAARVLILDAQLEARGGPPVVDDAIRDGVWLALQRASRDAEFAAKVNTETQEAVQAALDSYQRRRAELGATRREVAREQERRRTAALDELLGKKRKREAARFDARLRAP